MSKPTVSIIIPTYNRAKLLKRAVESVLKQDYPNIKEIIITDDGSTDNTKKVIEELKKRDKSVIYVKNKKYKKGPSGNKNNGLDYATGDFVGILDDDDELIPDAISKAIDVYLRRGYKFIFGNCLRGDNGKFSGKEYGKSEEVSYKDRLCRKYSGDYWEIVHKEIIDGERFPDDTWGGETILWYKIFKKTPGYYLHEPLRIYHIENKQRISNTYFVYPERSFLNYKYKLDLYGNDFIKFCPKRFIEESFSASFFARLSGYYKKAIGYLLLSFRVQGLFFRKLLFLFFIILPTPKPILIRLYKDLIKI